MEAETLIGKILFFKDAPLGRIIETKYSDVVWSHSKHWLFKLDNGLWFRDFRDNPEWHTERSKK